MADALLSVADLGVNLGDRWLMRHADVTISTGDRLCLVGRNGAGKSTLMKMMAGLGEPDEGSLWMAPGANVSYLPQAPTLPKGMSLASIVEHGTGSDGDYVAATHKAEAMLTRMGMDPNWMTDGLSGGESRRVALARALVKEPDVLLMDEPTNHLDLPTIEWMEDMLMARGGAMVVISHDRAFLRRIGNGTLWIDGGKLRRRQGSFDGFDEWAEVIQAEEATRLIKWIVKSPKKHAGHAKAFQPAANGIWGGCGNWMCCAKPARNWPPPWDVPPAWKPQLLKAVGKWCWKPLI